MTLKVFEVCHHFGVVILEVFPSHYFCIYVSPKNVHFLSKYYLYIHYTAVYKCTPYTAECLIYIYIHMIYIQYTYANPAVQHLLQLKLIIFKCIPTKMINTAICSMFMCQPPLYIYRHCYKMSFKLEIYVFNWFF